MTREDIEKKMHESAEEIKPLITTLVEALCEAHQKGYLAGVELGAKIAYPQWIPVEEELPEMYERVLVAGLDKRSKLKEPLLFVTCRAKEECGIECDSNGFSVGDMPFAYKKVTHWMPLPAAPRKEEKNE